MITLPSGLEQFMKGKDLKGLKPLAYLFRNKWIPEESESDESGDGGGYYALDTANPIDISGMILKPNTLSMTLDVNEVAQYNANNVTLTLEDTHNYFVEGTPNSYFPNGYQIYGSKVVLYYGLDTTNETPLFTGVIKELPTHKPDKYQVDLKLVSPLEMLKDIEAKDFSDKVTGEVLTLDHTGDNNEEFYLTAQKGVGGITALYANGVKLYEGVDYEVSQLNELNYNAVIEVKNSTVFGQTFTVDYYYWKRGLSVEEIVAGVVALGGYSGATTDIQPVAWQNAVRSPSTVSNVLGAIGYYESALNEYTFNWHNRYGNSWQNTQGTGGITNKLPANFDYSFTIEGGPTNIVPDDVGAICLGDSYNGATISETLDPNYQAANLGPVGVTNGITCRLFYGRVTHLGTSRRYIGVTVHSITNGTPTLLYSYEIPSSLQTRDVRANFEIKRRGNTINVYYEGNSVATATYNGSLDYHYQYDRRSSDRYNHFLDNSWAFFDSSLNQHGANFTRPCIVTDTLDMTAGGSSWGAVQAELDQDAVYFLNAYFSTDAGATWSGAYSYNIDVNMARPERYMYYVLGVPDSQASFDIKDPSTYFYASTLVLNIVNLGNSTVLEALQDLALISGYEFGVDRQGVFFFRPRVSSTTPVYVLDHSEIVKVDTVKKNLSDFFTKLTLTFAEVPLEFYANTGTRPTPIDKYGVINKDIDKPEIVNYDNPELAQAIGPQLLEVYSAMPNVIQAVGKLNLALELGDIINLKRNYNLIEPDIASDYDKYQAQQTYYRACKVTGMNYNFAKRQITYTLRDVSNRNNAPQEDTEIAYIYDNPVDLG